MARSQLLALSGTDYESIRLSFSQFPTRERIPVRDDPEIVKCLQEKPELSKSPAENPSVPQDPAHCPLYFSCAFSHTQVPVGCCVHWRPGAHSTRNWPEAFRIFFASTWIWPLVLTKSPWPHMTCARPWPHELRAEDSTARDANIRLAMASNCSSCSNHHGPVGQYAAKWADNSQSATSKDASPCLWITMLPPTRTLHKVLSHSAGSVPSQCLYCINRFAPKTTGSNEAQRSSITRSAPTLVELCHTSTPRSSPSYTPFSGRFGIVCGLLFLFE